METYEGGWLLELLHKPVLIYGESGSYKSYFAAFLALLRHILLGHQLEIADPRLHANRNSSWKSLIEMGVPAVGAHYDYTAVRERIEALEERIKYGDDSKPWVTPIFDELTRYGDEKELQGQTRKLLQMCIADVRGGHEAPILISHDKGLAFLGNAEGLRKAIDRGIIQVYFAGTTNREGYAPLFKGHIANLKDEQGKLRDLIDISIHPSWCHPEVLVKRFTPDLNPQRVFHQISNWEPQEEPTTDLKVSDDLGEPLRTIWRFCKEQGDWVSVRQIARKDFAVLKGKNSNDIRRYLGLLEDMGYGELDESEGSVRFRAY